MAVLAVTRSHGTMPCPSCGATAECDTVDVGPGIIERGNWLCMSCGWCKRRPSDDDLGLLPMGCCRWGFVMIGEEALDDICRAETYDDREHDNTPDLPEPSVKTGEIGIHRLEQIIESCQGYDERAGIRSVSRSLSMGEFCAILDLALTQLCTDQSEEEHFRGMRE